MPTPQQEKLKKAAEQFAPHILPNIGKFRWMARLQGVNLSDYGDLELLEIIKVACEMAQNGVRVFEFRPVYAA